MESFKELFEMVKEYTRQYVIDSKELSEIAYQVWIKSLEPVSFDGNTAVLYIKAEFMKKIVEEKYLGLLTKAFEAVVGFPVKVEILCETSSNPEKKEVSPASVQTSAPSAVLPSYSQEEIDMNSQGGEYEYTFATFIVGSSNKFAQAACRAVAQNPASAYNPLFIYGGSGLGKTHLLYAIASEIKESRPKTNVIYVKGEEFTNELIAAIGNESTQDFHDKYRQADVLLVDDIQFIGGKESTQEEFFHTFDSLYQDNKQIVLTSDRPPKEIKTLEERLRGSHLFYSDARTLDELFAAAEDVQWYTDYEPDADGTEYADASWIMGDTVLVCVFAVSDTYTWVVDFYSYRNGEDPTADGCYTFWDEERSALLLELYGENAPEEPSLARQMRGAWVDGAGGAVLLDESFFDGTDYTLGTMMDGGVQCWVQDDGSYIVFVLDETGNALTARWYDGSGTLRAEQSFTRGTPG